MTDDTYLPEFSGLRARTNLPWIEAEKDGFIEMYHIIPNAWETQNFKRSIGDLYFTDDDESYKKEIENFSGYGLIRCKVSASNFSRIDFLQRGGFKFIEGEIQFEYEIDHKHQHTNSLFDFAKEEDLDELWNISKSSFLNTRFREPYYSLTESSFLYSQWVKKSIHGTYDDVCLLCRDSVGNIAGFITLRENRDAISIGLICIKTSARNSGFGSTLLKMACEYAHKKSKRFVSVSTQTNNIAAQRLYVKNNFSVKTLNYWFYKIRY